MITVVFLALGWRASRQANWSKSMRIWVLLAALVIYTLTTMSGWLITAATMLALRELQPGSDSDKDAEQDQ